MRRILHIIDSLGRTGVAKQLLLLADGLLRSGYDVHIVELNAPARTCRNVGDAAQKRGAPSDAEIPVANLGRRLQFDPLAALRLMRHVARIEPDVVHTWNIAPAMLGPIVARNHVCLIAGCYGIVPWKPAWELWLESRLARHVTRFVTNSEDVRDWCTSRGLPAEKFAVVPPAVLPDKESDVSREELLAELHSPSDARLIGVVGRLVPEKRVQDLIWAADLLRVLHDNLRLLVIGDGPLRGQLEQYARRASDLDHIRFLGARDDVGRIMPHLDVLWNGSDNRSVSIAILEAMAAGVPVIASDVPVNREIVQHGETGYLIPVGRRSGRADRARHTDRIITDSALATRLKTAAVLRTTNSFGLDSVVQRHTDTYSTL